MMKLIDLIKRIEAVGLEAMITVSKAGDMHVIGRTSPPSSRANESSNLLNVMLDNKTSRTRNDVASIEKMLAKAAQHPDAIWLRELKEQWAKEDAEWDAKRAAERAAA